MQFIAQPYVLHNDVQHYEWGTKDQDAFIPRFTGTPIIAGKPYAELWIGAHPKCPSTIEIDGTRLTLQQAVAQFPAEILGPSVVQKFGAQFPFLLKVLSAACALSIQTHPNRVQARALHARDPKNYPDDNHKPEIAIALDGLDAMAGFRPVTEIQNYFRLYPAIARLCNTETAEAFITTTDKGRGEQLAAQLYRQMMQNSVHKTLLAEVIESILGAIGSKTGPVSAAEEQFGTQFKIFGTDIGLLSLFFFNIIHLNPWQAIFTDAGVPHAYIRGNIIECMANSDNVVRAGLTPKFTDVETLTEIIRYQFGGFPLINEGQIEDEVVYHTGADEFEISLYTKSTAGKTDIQSEQKVSVLMMLEGTAVISWQDGSREISVKQGSAVLLPAALRQISLTPAGLARYIIVRVPV